MRTSIGVFIVAVVSGGAVARSEITLTIDPSLSEVTVDLCVLDGCDTDSSPVAGAIVIDVDPPVDPTAVTLFDYTFMLTQTLVFHIGNAFGAVDSTVVGGTLQYPTPGVPLGPTPIDDAGGFTFFNVPTVAGGTTSYNATGLFCVAFIGQGLPCDGQFDLAALGVQSVDMMSGTLSIANNEVTLMMDAAGTVPLLPGVVDLSFVANIVATGTIQAVPGDSDGDGDVDVFDFDALLGCVSGPDEPLSPEVCAVFDFDGDGDVDFGDAGAFQIAFTGGG